VPDFSHLSFSNTAETMNAEVVPIFALGNAIIQTVAALTSTWIAVRAQQRKCYSTRVPNNLRRGKRPHAQLVLTDGEPIACDKYWRFQIKSIWLNQMAELWVENRRFEVGLTSGQLLIIRETERDKTWP
jgi:hypothetical protein